MARGILKRFDNFSSRIVDPPLDLDETIVLENSATHVRFPFSELGTLTLTTKKLFFSARNRDLIPLRARTPITIRLSEVDSVELVNWRKTFAGAPPGLPGFEIVARNDSRTGSMVFQAKHPSDWVTAIRALLSAIRSE